MGGSGGRGVLIEFAANSGEDLVQQVTVSSRDVKKNVLPCLCAGFMNKDDPDLSTCGV